VPLTDMTVQTIADGPKNLVLHLTGKGDGNGDAKNVVIVDVAALAIPCARVRIDSVDYDVSYGVTELLWEADVPQRVALFDGSNRMDYRCTGGLNNPMTAIGSTGNLLLSTDGFEANSTYDLLLEMTKKF
jgi:hypothetical protein